MYDLPRVMEQITAMLHPDGVGVKVNLAHIFTDVENDCFYQKYIKGELNNGQ